MALTTVNYVDAALTRLCRTRAAFKPEAFYRQCDKLLDARLRAELVMRLEAEHVELAGAR